MTAALAPQGRSLLSEARGLFSRKQRDSLSVVFTLDCLLRSSAAELLTRWRLYWLVNEVAGAGVPISIIPNTGK